MGSNRKFSGMLALLGMFVLAGCQHYKLNSKSHTGICAMGKCCPLIRIAAIQAEHFSHLFGYTYADGESTENIGEEPSSLFK